MQIANGRILEQNAVFQRHDVLTKGENISDITQPYYESEEEIVIDAEGGYVLPGFIDLCVRGAAENPQRTAAELAKQGVTRFLAAMPWQGAEAAAAQMEALAQTEQSQLNAVLEGVRLEGPCLAKERAEAACAEALAEPNDALTEQLLLLTEKNLKMMDFAPELPRATSLLKKMAQKCRMSVGYTAANYDQARIGFALGARHVSDVSNLWNTCTAAAPGVLGAAAESAGMVDLCPCEEGLHPAALRMAVQLFGPERICFVSKGGAPGARTGTLADCLRTAAWFGIPLPYAVKAVSLNPARALGIENRVGSIEIGKRADIVVLDLHDLSLRTVVLGGKIVYDKNQSMSLGG